MTGTASPKAALAAADKTLAAALPDAAAVLASATSGDRARRLADAVAKARPGTAAALAGWPQPPPVEPAPLPPDPGPPAGAVHEVATARELQQASAAAKPGDTIRMKPNEYAKNSFDAPAVLYLAAGPGVVVAVPGVVAGKGTTVQGVEWANTCRVNGASAGLRACTVRGKGDAEVALHLFGPECFAEWSEVRDFPHRGVQVTGARSRLARSHLHHQVFKGSDITQGTAGLIVGGYHADQDGAQTPIDCLIDHVLIEDCAYHNFAEIKGNGSTWTNVATRATGKVNADLYVRWGRGHSFVACFVEGVLGLGDEGNTAIDCVTANRPGACLALRCGGVTADQMAAGKKGYPYAVRARVAGHGGRVHTAWKNGTGAQWAVKPVGTVLEGIDKSQIDGDGDYRLVPRTAAASPEPARLLSPDELGPGAYARLEAR